MVDAGFAGYFHVPPERRFEWLQVETVDGKFAFARGDGHSAEDVAAAAVRRLWRGSNPARCAVTDRAGRCLRHNPSAFKAAATIFVGKPSPFPPADA